MTPGPQSLIRGGMFAHHRVAFVVIAAMLAGACSAAPEDARPAAPTATVESTANPTSSSSTTTEPTPPCIPSGDHTDIQDALVGDGAVALLCQNSVFRLGDTVFLTAPNQQIFTQGLPTDDSRALLRIADSAVATAVSAEEQDGSTLRNVIVDGSRPEFGAAIPALLEWGGTVDGLVEWVRAYEPRGWSILYLGEGGGHRCRNAVARHNELGPGGSAEFGMADGISLGCRDSVVEDNLIYDVTDGGIVIFQATGSLIARNTIRADERVMFYGISMEDYGPFDGDFTGTLVVGNTIDARGALIRRGIAMGPQLGCIPDGASSLISRGASVTDNLLLGDNMGYGFIIGGVTDWTATGNVDRSTHRVPARELNCFGDEVDAPAGFQVKSDVSSGTFQDEFVDSVLGFTVNWWPTIPIASPSCISNLIGEDVFVEIRSGDRGPILEAMEATPEGALVERCVDIYQPELTGGGAEGVVFTASDCGPLCTQLTLLNLADETVDLTGAEFFVDMFAVPCEDLPAELAPLENAQCEITDFVAAGSQVVWWRGFHFLNQHIVVEIAGAS